MSQTVITTRNAPSALTKSASRQPRRKSADRIAIERTIAPSCVNTSARRLANTANVPRRFTEAQRQRASAGQNTACAIHISVGAPKTSGQRHAVERQAYPKITRLVVRSAASVTKSPSKGAEKNNNP